MKTLHLFVLAALLAALGSTQAMAQQAGTDKPGHVVVNFGPWGHMSGDDAKIGEIRRGSSTEDLVIPLKNPNLLTFRFDRTPANGLGFGGGFTRVNVSGKLNGSEPSTSQVRYWGVDPRPFVASGDRVDFSNIGYAASAHRELTRIDGLAIWGHGGPSGYGTIFGGLAYANFKSEIQQSQERKIFFHNVPPGKPEDPLGDLEIYRFNDTAAGSYHGWGPQIGGEGNFCPFGALVFQARGDIAWFKTTAASTGLWDWTKSGYLVPSAQGLNATPGADLFPPIHGPSSFKDSLKSNVRATELEASVRLRLSAAAQIGFGPSWARYSGVPGAPTWVVPSGFSPEKGHWTSGASSSFTYWAWTVSASVRF